MRCIDILFIYSVLYIRFVRAGILRWSKAQRVLLKNTLSLTTNILTDRVNIYTKHTDASKQIVLTKAKHKKEGASKHTGADCGSSRRYNIESQCTFIECKALCLQST